MTKPKTNVKGAPLRRPHARRVAQPGFVTYNELRDEVKALRGAIQLHREGVADILRGLIGSVDGALTLLRERLPEDSGDTLVNLRSVLETPILCTWNDLASDIKKLEREVRRLGRSLEVSDWRDLEDATRNNSTAVSKLADELAGVTETVEELAAAVRQNTEAVLKPKACEILWKSHVRRQVNET